MNSELERDIVERLRDAGTDCDWNGVDGGIQKDPLLHEAADEITRLRAALSTEAQPEVTGAVAQLEPIGYIDREQLKRWDILRGTEFEVAERTYIPFSKSPFKSEFTDCTLPVYSEPSPSAIEGYAQELAKRLVREKLDANLIDRCKEVRSWQKTGVLKENSKLQEYADKYYSGLENNLLNAEADTGAQAMQLLIDLSAP